MPKIKLEAHQKDGKVLSINSKKKNRIFDFIQRAKKLETTKYVVRVTYGRYEDNLGKHSLFKNEGEYHTYKNLKYALNAFTEGT